MHPADEAGLMSELLRDPAVLLIDGPRWKSSTPSTTRDISAVGGYCIIWSPGDLPQLPARYIPSCNDWYCTAEYATIQFVRCSLADTTIRQGRLAISTGPANERTAANVEHRYKSLARAIKKTYLNSIVRWRNPDLPEAPATPGRSANPSKPDRSLWVGPAAMTWLRADRQRHIKPLAGGAEGAISIQ
jgi:hypothetical protein